ncbi:MAG: branched-chain amino acid transport system permease protein [Solirubrobacteraceae bacterium]|nr:branched-chain amino acid transport system permease protein [Solirubrobacteraceae bacterium]
MTASIFIPSVGFGLVTASILALAAVGFTLQFGVTNILNLAYGDLMTAAAYIGYVVNRHGGSIALSLLAGAAFGALSAFLLNRLVYTPFLRRGTKLFGMVIVTLSVGVIIQNTLLAIGGATFFTYNFSVGSAVHPLGFVFNTSQLMIIGLAVAAMIVVQLLLTQTRLGKAMRATAANPGLAQASGIATDRVVDIAWLLSGLLCGLAGVVLVLNTTAFQSTTGSGFLVIIIAAAMLGGVGRATGAMVGALVLGLVTEISAAYISPSYKEIFAFGVLVIVLLVRPTGIFTGAQREVAG